jgi:hypothetical protein
MGEKPTAGRRASIALAGTLLLFSPVVASARLRAILLRATNGEVITSQTGQDQRDVAAIQSLFARMRGTNRFACELAMVSVDRGNWFGGLDELSGGPFADDSLRVFVPRELYASAVEPLWTALRDPDRCVRRTAASLLGRTKALRASERLRGALDDSDAEIRALAAFALGLAEDQAAAARLQALLRDNAANVRSTAAWALGELEYRPAIEQLAELLIRDPIPAVRRAAARALGSIAG